MPVYDYKCPDHGIFHELATMDNSDKPVACPVCQKLSARVIMMAPGILDMSPVKRKAHQHNEQACHEPHHSTVETRLENEDRLKHGCGCKYEKRTSNLMYTADGSKIFPSMRPWMISH